MQHSIQLPKARKEKLIVKELADETLVYDLENDRAHCLNQTAASVWKHCDGKATVSELAALLEAETNAAVPDAIRTIAPQTIARRLQHAFRRLPLHQVRRPVFKVINWPAVQPW